jgi:hypothetical protein
MAQHPLVGQGLLSIEGSRSHLDTPHSVGLLVISQTQRPLPDIQHLQETDIYAPVGIRTRNPRKRAAGNPLLRPGWALFLDTFENYPKKFILVCANFV